MCTHTLITQGKSNIYLAPGLSAYDTTTKVKSMAGLGLSYQALQHMFACTCVTRAHAYTRTHTQAHAHTCVSALLAALH